MGAKRRWDRAIGSAGLLAIVLVATYPLFLETFRQMIFQTHPRDDYAPYLLWVIDKGGEVYEAPFGYRLFSVLVAVPFYFVLPIYHFSQLPPNVDVTYIRATQALAFSAWFGIAVVAVLVFRIARDRLGASRNAAIAVFLAVPLFIRYAAPYGVDPVAIAAIAAALYWIERPLVFAGIALLSVGFNEKIWMVLALLLAGRVAANPRQVLASGRLQVLAVGAAVLAYFAIRYHFNLPGNEGQTVLASYPRKFASTLARTASLKGFSQNAFPIAICLAAYAAVLAVRRRVQPPAAYWSPGDIVVPLGLAAIGLLIDVGFTLGRLVMHALPLLAPPVALVLDAASRDATREDSGVIPPRAPDRADHFAGAP
jgi:hypothetical protein